MPIWAGGSVWTGTGPAPWAQGNTPLPYCGYRYWTPEERKAPKNGPATQLGSRPRWHATPHRRYARRRRPAPRHKTARRRVLGGL